MRLPVFVHVDSVWKKGVLVGLVADMGMVEIENRVVSFPLTDIRTKRPLEETEKVIRDIYLEIGGEG